MTGAFTYVARGIDTGRDADMDVDADDADADIDGEVDL